MRLVPGHADNDAGSTPRDPEGSLLTDNIPSPRTVVHQGVVVMDGANIAWGWGISHPNLLGMVRRWSICTHLLV